MHFRYVEVRVNPMTRKVLTEYASWVFDVGDLQLIPGFGLFNKLQRYQLYGVVVLVWAVLLLLSPLWLRQFRFGPLEWVWDWKKQPFRITGSD